MPYRVQMITTGFNGAPGYNTFYTPTIFLPDVEEWVTGINTFITGLQSVMQQDVVMTRSADIEEFDPVDGQTTAVITGTAFIRNGSFGANHEVDGATLVAQLRTGSYLNGREVRGRMYLSGLASIRDANGSPSSAALADAGGALGDYVATGLAGVWSRTNGTMRTVTGGGIWNRFGLVRSRRD